MQHGAFDYSLVSRFNINDVRKVKAVILRAIFALLLASSILYRKRINLICTINVWESAKCPGTFSVQTLYNEESSDIKVEDGVREEGKRARGGERTIPLCRVVM